MNNSRQMPESVHTEMQSNSIAIGLSPVFSFRRYLPPILAQHSQAIRLLENVSYRSGCRAVRGYHPLWRHIPMDLDPSHPRKRFFKLQFGQDQVLPDFNFELFPLHSPLLRESLLVSFPLLTDMLKFSGSPCLIWDQCFRCSGKFLLTERKSLFSYLLQTKKKAAFPALCS